MQTYWSWYILIISIPDLQLPQGYLLHLSSNAMSFFYNILNVFVFLPLSPIGAMPRGVDKCHPLVHGGPTSGYTSREKQAPFF